MKMPKKRIIYTIAVTLIVVFSTTFAILMTLERRDYRNYLLGEYSRSMYDLIDSVGNIRANLGKAAVSGTNEQRIITFEEIYRNSAMASDKLHSLPVPQNVLGDTSKFLSQVGDFCYSLVRATTEGNEISDQDYKNIDRLKDEAYSLQNQLNSTLSDINQGKVKWGEIRAKVGGVLAKNNSNGNGILDKFQSIQKQVVEYPALIYDGPFSENTLEIQPKVNSLKDVSLEDAKNNLKKAIGDDRISKIENVPSSTNTRIEAYRFNVYIKGRNNNEKIACEVTKKGGKIIYLIDERTLGNPSLNVDKAVEAGNKFLKNIGYDNMTSTYVLQYDKNIVVNYVYNQQNIIIYPDQIKLKIALDNGEITGMESEKFLVAHEENRNLSTPKVTMDDAKNKVGKRLEINNIRLTVIPTESNKEVLCYEFSGSYKGDNYKVYINTQTGREQRIIQIINTPNGQLTI